MNEKTDSKTFLFVLAPANLQRRGSEGWFSEQVEVYVNQLRKQGNEVVMAFSPNFGGVRARTTSSFSDPRPHALIVFALKFPLALNPFHSGLQRENSFLDRLRKIWFDARAKAIRDVAKREKVDVICGINLAETEFRAAQELGIKTIEFQHGHISPSFATKLSGGSGPDYFAHWFTWDRDEIAKAGKTPICVGLPYLGESSKGRALREIIFFAFQYNHGSSLDSLGFVDSALEPFLRFDWDVLGLRPVARFHPATSHWRQLRAKRQLSSVFPKVEFMLSREGTLDSILSNSAAVLSSFSSIWIDSIVRGVPSFSLVEIPATSRLSYPLSSLVSVVSSPSELVRGLERRKESVSLENVVPLPSIEAIIRALSIVS